MIVPIFWSLTVTRMESGIAKPMGQSLTAHHGDCLLSWTTWELQPVRLAEAWLEQRLRT